jgi:hypothetical protein
MKHLLNDLSSEEKNSILEQHNGGMKIDTSKFRTLLESKLGNSKPLVNEEEEEELVVVDASEIKPEEMECFRDSTEEELKVAGLTDGKRPKKPKTKIKHKKCQTTIRTKGPTQTWRSTNW